MHKKLFFIYLVFVFSLSLILILPDKKPIYENLNGLKDVSYYFYSLDCLESTNLYFVKNGNMNIVKCDEFNAKSVKNKLTDIRGESITFSGNKLDALTYLSNFNYRYVLSEDISGIFTLYAYSPLIQNYVYINNQKVNIEVAVSKNIVTIGSPIILGSY